MTKARVEVIAVARRRHWPRAEKERLVAASFAEGSSASEVARTFGLHVSQLFRWRKQLAARAALHGGEEDGSAPAPDDPGRLADGAPRTAPIGSGDCKRRPGGTIEISLSGGQCIRVDGDVDIEALRRVIDVLDKR